MSLLDRIRRARQSDNPVIERRLQQVEKQASARPPLPAPPVRAVSTITHSRGPDFEYVQGYSGVNRDFARTDEGAIEATRVNVAAGRAVDARSDAVEGMPWVIKDSETGDVLADSTESNPTNPLARALLNYQREHGTGLFGRWERSLCVTGKAFIEPVMPAQSMVANGLDWLNPVAMRFIAPFGRIQGYVYSANGRYTPYAKHEIVYHRYVGFDDVEGYSPLLRAIRKVAILENTDRFLQSFFGNDTRFGAIYAPKGETTAFNEREQAAIKRQIEGNKGVDSNFRMLVSPRPMDVYYPPQPELDKFGGSEDRAASTVLWSLGVPRAVAGDADSQRYQASPQELHWFYQQTVIPDCKKIAGMVNAGIVPKFDPKRSYYLEFDTSAWNEVSESQAKEIGIVRQAFLDGAIPLNKYLAALDQFVTATTFDQLDNGDVYYMPSTSVQMRQDQIGSLQGKPSYIIYQSPQLTVQQAIAMAEDAGVNVPSPPPPETNPQSQAPVELTDPDNLALPPGQRSMKAMQDDVISELETWRKFAHKHDGLKALRFETHHLDDEITARIRFALVEDDTLSVFDDLLIALSDALPDVEPDYITAHRKHLSVWQATAGAIEASCKRLYAAVTAQRSVSSIRIDYEDSVTDILSEAVAGNLTRARFVLLMNARNELTIDRVYLQGLTDGGVSGGGVDVLTEDDLSWIDQHKRETRQFVQGVANQIYADERVTPDETEGRAGMWWRMSIDPAYGHAVRSAAGNAAFERVIGATEEHCRDCRRINGQVRRASFWEKIGIWNASPKTECGGFNCKCQNTPTNKPITRGRFPNIYGP